MTDPIADLLTRIRNAYAVRKASLRLPYSRFNHQIAQALQAAGYLQAVSVDRTDTVKPSLDLILTYLDGEPVITRIDRVSKPGRRVYIQAKDITPVLSGHGLTLISTSQGILTGQAAKRQNLGGEVICRVW